MGKGVPEEAGKKGRGVLKRRGQYLVNGMGWGGGVLLRLMRQRYDLVDRKKGGWV